MTYYEEDAEEWIERVKKSVENEKPMYIPVPKDMSQERHEELMEMLGGIFVQLSRVYDVLMFLVTPEQQKTIDDLHSAGELFASPPILKEKAWGDSDDK
jgi:hypothetical protein